MTATAKGSAWCLVIESVLRKGVSESKEDIPTATPYQQTSYSRQVREKRGSMSPAKVPRPNYPLWTPDNFISAIMGKQSMLTRKRPRLKVE